MLLDRRELFSAHLLLFAVVEGSTTTDHSGLWGARWRLAILIVHSRQEIEDVWLIHSSIIRLRSAGRGNHLSCIFQSASNFCLSNETIRRWLCRTKEFPLLQVLASVGPLSHNVLFSDIHSYLVVVWSVGYKSVTDHALIGLLKLRFVCKFAPITHLGFIESFQLSRKWILLFVQICLARVIGHWVAHRHICFHWLSISDILSWISDTLYSRCRVCIITALQLLVVFHSFDIFQNVYMFSDFPYFQ